MDFSPNPDHALIVEAVDAVCATYDDTYWAQRDERHEFPWDFYADMAAGGWVGIAIPEAYGGGGQGIAEAAIVLNRVAASGAAMNGSTALHLTMFGLNPVVKFGNEQLKETFLPRAAAIRLQCAVRVGRRVCAAAGPTSCRRGSDGTGRPRGGGAADRPRRESARRL